MATSWSWTGRPLGSFSLAVISHGLEGNSRRPYVLSMVRAFNRAGWDALAWNFRGCGGQINRRLRFYHSGATEDLGAVVDHALASERRLPLVRPDRLQPGRQHDHEISGRAGAGRTPTEPW